MGGSHADKIIVILVVILTVFVVISYGYKSLSTTAQPVINVTSAPTSIPTNTPTSTLRPTISKTCTKWHPGHYVIIDPISNNKFSSNGLRWNEEYLEHFLSNLDSNFKGIEIPVLWRSIERSKNDYDFEYTDVAVRTAEKFNKRVFFLITERVYNSPSRPVPDYVYDGKEYGGGAYNYSGNGQVAAVWNGEVQTRFYELIRKLGERYNNTIVEGVIFPESALNISPQPVGATPANYSEYLERRVEVAKQAFPTSLVFQGFNWGAETILPEHSLMNSVGFHGPDLVPDTERRSEKKRIPAYDYFPLYANKIPLASDVQSPQLKRSGEWGNFTLEGIYAMGVDTLKLNYIFWATLEWGPNYYNYSDVTSFIRSKKGEIKNSTCPSAISPCCPK